MGLTRELKTEDVLVFLQQRRRARASAPAIEERKARAYRQAASVLASIREPSKLRPLKMAQEDGEGERLLRDQFVHSTGQKLGGRVILRPEARRQGLLE